MITINPNTLDLIEHEAQDESWVEQMIERIYEENPGFYELIDRIGETGESRHAAIGAVLIAYRMFETQTEINDLENQFNEGS